LRISLTPSHRRGRLVETYIEFDKLDALVFQHSYPIYCGRITRRDIPSSGFEPDQGGDMDLGQSGSQFALFELATTPARPSISNSVAV